MESKVNLKKWLENYKAGKYDAKDVKTQIEAGWFDKFCSDRALAGRLKKMAPAIKRIAKSPKVHAEKIRIIFKNNCPCVGNLYDDFRLCDMETGNVLYTVVPKSGCDSNKGASEVWGCDNDFNGPIVEGSMDDVYKFFDV